MLILDPNQVNIGMVFETLNYRGKSLSKLEILKNRLMYLTSKRYGEDEAYSTEIRIDITRTWMHLYEWLGKGKSTIESVDDDAFLRSFWIMYFNHDDIRDSDFDYFEYDLFENQYKINDIHTNQNLAKDQIDRFLKTISNSVEAWFYINHPDQISADHSYFVSNSFSYYLNLLKKIPKGSYVQPFLISLIIKDSLNSSSEDSLNALKTEVIQAVEKHNVYLFLLKGKSSDTNRAEFWRFANKTHENRAEGSTAQAIINHIEQLKVKQSKTGGGFYEHIHTNRQTNERFWDWNGRDYILLQYEWHLRNTPLEKRDLSMNFTTYRLYSIDSNRFKFPIHFFVGLTRSDSDSMSKIQNSIGNIFIGNNSKKSRDFSDSELTFENEKTSLSGRESWTYNTILERGMQILEFVEKQYSVTFGDDSKKRKLILDGIINTTQE